MDTKTVTRLDPLNTVVHYELLRVAHMLMVKKQNFAYWQGVPYPKRPIGRVRHEVARQVSVFAIPFLMLMLGWVIYHGLGLLVSVPLAWLVGFVLDKLLTRAISEKLQRDIRIDSGRYRAVMWLSTHMGMAPDEITLPVIYKMAADYRDVATKLLAAEAAQKARVAATRRPPARSDDDGYADTRSPNGSSTSAESSSSNYVEDDDWNDRYSYPEHHIAVNPASGWPMNPGGITDTMGNLYGTNNN